MKRLRFVAPYAELLGRDCWACVGNETKAHKCKVIAVSHKGAVCVRRASNKSGKGGKWIDKESVSDRVWWRFHDVPMDKRGRND